MYSRCVPWLPLSLSFAGLALVLGTWVAYLRTIPRGTVPVWPAGSIAVLSVGLALAVGGAAVGLGRDGSAAALGPAVGAVGFGAFFFWLLSQRKTPVGDIKVAVGDSILPFEAVSAGGARWHTDDLARRRVLLKFFRGGW